MESGKEWRKCIAYNKGIMLSETNIINLIDTDAIIHPKFLLETADKLTADKYLNQRLKELGLK